MGTLTEYVVMNRASPTRDFGNVVKLTLREDRVAITDTVTRVVLTLTKSGTETVLDSDDSDFTFTWADGVLSMDLSGAISTAGKYAADLDVWIGGVPFRWTGETALYIIAR